MSLFALSASEMRARLDAKEISVRELLESHLERIESCEPKINAFLTLTTEIAYKNADEAQEKINKGESNFLTGIPIAIKDNIVMKGIRTTCGSKILENWIPPFESTLVEKLKRSSPVLVGKTNLDEFAMGSSTEFSGFKVTRNPWDIERVPGGSSGGSAAAVSAGFVPLAYGSDTGGSVRQPASLCGVVGLKPTYGRISRYGLVAFSSSLDQIGPFGRTVEDVIFAFEAAMGRDVRDSTTVDAPYNAQMARTPQIKGRKIGVPKELVSEEVSPEVMKVIQETIELLTKEGAEVEEISLPMISQGVSTYYIIAPAEASSNLARYDGVRYGLRIPATTAVEMMKITRSEGFGKEVKERIIIGTYVLSAGYYEAFYAKAHKARTVIKQQLREAFQTYDVLLGPTSPIPAFRIGERIADPLAMKLADYCTIPANIGGFPAINLFAGFSDGLPVGVQLIADTFGEETLFSIALGMESILPKVRIAPC